MGLLSRFQKFMGGYPGGWQASHEGARAAGGRPGRSKNLGGGSPGGWRPPQGGPPGPPPPPWAKPAARDARRSLIPPLGLREYWYPALPAKGVGWKKPVGLRMLGT